MPGPKDAVRLAEVLCARLSHDLGGTIGTLSNALDLATDDTPIAAEALLLARDAAAEAHRRLALLRATWGPDGQLLSLAELRDLASGIAPASRVALDLSALPPDTAFGPRIARGLLNLLLVAADSLGGRGAISLTGNATEVLVAIAGPRAAWPPNFLACVADEATAWAAVRDARSIVVPLAALLIRGSSLRLSAADPASPEATIPRLCLAEA